MNAFEWFVLLMLWICIAVGLGWLFGNMSAASAALDNALAAFDDDDCDDLACIDWDCNECQAEIEAARSRHPSSQRPIQDPFTARTWWA